MSKKSFKFEPSRWSGNRSLRACSPAARGFWVDLLCICSANAGYLHINEHPVDDSQLARMVGESVKSVRAWLVELGEAGVFSVDDKGLYSSHMRKTVGTAKVARKAAPRPAVQAPKATIVEPPATGPCPV